MAAAISERNGSTIVVRRKRVRRRRQDKSAITARLVLDEHVKTDVGIISGDLFVDLFPHLQHSWFPLSLCSLGLMFVLVLTIAELYRP
jgi:hypothetical protein